MIDPRQFRDVLGTYPTGVKIPDSQMTALNDTGALHHHEWHPEWNYTLTPPSK